MHIDLGFWVNNYPYNNTVDKVGEILFKLVGTMTNHSNT